MTGWHKFLGSLFCLFSYFFFSDSALHSSAQGLEIIHIPETNWVAEPLHTNWTAGVWGVIRPHGVLKLSPIHAFDLNDLAAGWIADLQPVEAEVKVTTAGAEGLNHCFLDGHFDRLNEWASGFVGCSLCGRLVANNCCRVWDVTPRSQAKVLKTLPTLNVIYCCQG